MYVGLSGVLQVPYRDLLLDVGQVLHLVRALVGPLGMTAHAIQDLHDEVCRGLVQACPGNRAQPRPPEVISASWLVRHLGGKVSDLFV